MFLSQISCLLQGGCGLPKLGPVVEVTLFWGEGQAHLNDGFMYRLHLQRKDFTKYPEKELHLSPCNIKWLKCDLCRAVCCLQRTKGGRQKPMHEDIVLPAVSRVSIPKD